MRRPQYDLAAFYKEGRGVQKDEKKAAYWMCKAADAGLTNAELEYGIALYLGKGVKKNETAGFDMLRRAAEKGNPVGAEPARPCIRRGRGTKSTRSRRQMASALAPIGCQRFRPRPLPWRAQPDERTKAEKAAYDWQQATAALMD